MFTGLVEFCGRLERRTNQEGGARLCVVASKEVGWTLGESVAVNGVCLTVAASEGAMFIADCSEETLQRTTLGQAPIGSMLHLERALAVGDRLGGHFVSGHVDGVGRLTARHAAGSSWRLSVAVPDHVAPFLAPKAAITVDGVSLTVNGVAAASFDVMIVPHTGAVTNLNTLRVGACVNLEVDMLARYIARLLSPRGQDSTGNERWLDLLQRQGYT